MHYMSMHSRSTGTCQLACDPARATGTEESLKRIVHHHGLKSCNFYGTYVSVSRDATCHRPSKSVLLASLIDDADVAVSSRRSR